MTDRLTVAIVGAGPCGTQVLERLGAHARLRPTAGGIEVHLVDPFPPGAGRIWRTDQSPLLWVNSVPGHVLLFPDDSSTGLPPALDTTSFLEWIEQVQAGDPSTAGLADDLRAEAHAAGPTTYPTRRLTGAYLEWCFGRVVDGLPSTVQVHVHRDRVTALDESDNGVQWVRTEGGLNLAADAVVLTLGHVGAEPAGDTAALLDWCRGQGLPALGPDHGVDVDLTAFTAAHRVLVRGMGLAFVDLLILLTEGRGGRFEEVDGAGDVRYEPSGAEPQLLVGSRRGVPYQCKPTDQVRRGSLGLPRFFSDDVVSGLLDGHEPLEFRRDVWPLIAKEACWGFYQQLHASQPDRLSLPWEEFVTRFAEVDWGALAFDQFIATAVPSEEDRLNLQALAEPLAGRRFADQASLQRWITERSRGDLARCTDPRRSAELGAFFALLECFPGLARVLASPRLDPRATLDEFEGWWFLLFSSFASGPPPARLRQLLALANAGVVRFIGAGLQVHPDAAAGILRATTDSVPEVFEADAFIDARHPGPSATLATDGLLRTLVATRAASEATVADVEQRRSTGRLRVGAGGRVVDRDGRPHPRRLALGPHTVARAPAFARPGSDAPAFRQNDAAARALLDLGPVLGPRALDNAVWHALARSLWRFAHWSGRSARFTPEVSVFAAVPDEPSSDDWRALARLVGPGGTAVLFRDQVDEPDGWTSLAEIPGVQMDGTGAAAAVSVEVALLGEADLDEMVSLAARTRPGPFARRTPELGRYYGVRREGELVAMAGERLRLPGRTEISAVCTHQAHRGRGLASVLVRHAVAEIRARGDQPFLHAATDNTNAIALYEKLGFEVRREVTAVALRAPGPRKGN